MKHLEDDLQIAVADLLDSLGWLWWHTPNGGRRGKIEGARFKRMGVKAGVPDVLIQETWVDQGEDGLPVFGMGVAIELKAPGGRLSKEQKAMLAKLKARGFQTAVCRSLDEVLAVLELVEPMNGRKVVR
jgi:hypothetical protein